MTLSHARTARNVKTVLVDVGMHSGNVEDLMASGLCRSRVRERRVRISPVADSRHSVDPGFVDGWTKVARMTLLGTAIAFAGAPLRTFATSHQRHPKTGGGRVARVQPNLLLQIDQPGFQLEEPRGLRGG